MRTLPARTLAARRLALPRVLALALATGLAGALAGACSSASAPAASAVTVSGAFGKAPAVRIPPHPAGQSLAVRTLIAGHGPAWHLGDAFIGNYAVYAWSGTTHRLLQSTFEPPGVPTLFSGRLLPGLQTALAGKRMGSRVLAVLPPRDAFGPQGNPQAGIKGTDTLVWVIDMIRDFPATASASGKEVSRGGGGLPTVSPATGTAPKITMPSGRPPSRLVAKTLIAGSGPKVVPGETVVVQYVGAIWRNGRVFDSTWSRRQPFGFTIGATPSQVIPGWDQGLAGQAVGSRVLLVIPPADGYGKTGNPQVGIRPSDTLVFVIDILGAFRGAGSG
jgi:FKBP-type peptidyl-prolyl cis-trans isomerase